MKSLSEVRSRKVEVNVKGSIILYEENYVLDENGNEIFDRDIEIENDKRLYDIYKSKNNLLTTDEIKKIREKYNLNQKEYALVIGVGEITIHRFERGSVQTEAVDRIMKLSNDPDNMHYLLMQNKGNVDKNLFNRLLKRIEELQTLKKHLLININELDLSLKFKEETSVVVAENIIKVYNKKVDKLVKEYDILPEYITNLKLQKLLYYVQAICLKAYGRKAYPEKIIAWSYGPIVNEVYQKYKKNHAEEITVKETVHSISPGLMNIIENVVDTYGSFDANKLINFTHEEEPWKNTKVNSEIDIQLIKLYFDKVYNSY